MNSVLKKLSRALRHPFSTRYAFKRLAEYHSQPRSLEEVGDWAMNFIDGDHTEAGVTADYNDDKDFVRPGGLIAFHDIVEHQPLPTNQVFHLWKRLKTLAPVKEFINDPKQCGFGIGLLHVPTTGTAALPA